MNSEREIIEEELVYGALRRERLWQRLGLLGIRKVTVRRRYRRRARRATRTAWNLARQNAQHLVRRR